MYIFAMHIKEEIIIFSLILISACVLYASEEAYGIDDKIEINLIAATIIKEAYAHTPYQIQVCKTLKDIERLYRKNEQTCLLHIQQEFHIDKYTWNIFLSTIKKLKHNFQKKYFRKRMPCINHSLHSIDNVLYSHIVDTLKLYGIHPHYVSITYDEKYHSINQDCIAYAWTRKHYTQHDAGMSFLPSSKMHHEEYHQVLTVLHECMHLWEIHSIQVSLLHMILKALCYGIEDFLDSTAIKAWQKIQEMGCEILPLIKFKNKKHAELQVKRSVNYGIDTILQGEKIVWNHSPPAETHPNKCDELLPWFLKINDILHPTLNSYFE